MSFYTSRGQRALLNAKEIDANSVAAFLPHDIFYLTGFWGEGIFLQKEDARVLIVPALEVNRARRDSEGADVQIIGAERGSQILEMFLKQVVGTKVCIDNVDYKVGEYLKKKTTVKVGDAIEKARIIKDEDEIERLINGGKIMDGVIELAIRELRENITEKELNASIIKACLDNGADMANYASTLSPNIVAFEENTAYPHHLPTAKKLKFGHLALFDLTLRYAGYVIDTTRTVSFGKAGQEKRGVYELVRTSQEAGVEDAKPGISASDLDNHSRSLLGNYAKYFIHSLGHGIGVEIHEAPYIGPSSNFVLQENMAITIEPGIYLPEKFGVRIEDSLIIKRNNPLPLNRLSKELIEITS